MLIQPLAMNTVDKLEEEDVHFAEHVLPMQKGDKINWTQG